LVKKVNQNKRIACVLTSTSDNLQGLNLNQIGAIFVVETDWAIERNNNIKRFFTRVGQGNDARFYNLCVEDSVEQRANVFDVDLRSTESDIAASIFKPVEFKADKVGYKHGLF
jgi:hypothetical protein